MFDRFIEHYRKSPTGKKVKIIIITLLIILFGPPFIANTIQFLASLDFRNCVPQDKATFMTDKADVCKN